jgi:hypothetical protein
MVMTYFKIIPISITALTFSLLSLLFTSCKNNTPAKESEVYEIRNIGTLASTEYTLSKVVKWNDKGEWYKFGDRKLLLSTKARVKAGVNLAKLKEEDFHVNGDHIEIVLPMAEVISFEMDPNFTRTEITEVSGLRSDFSQEEKQKVMQKAEQAIRIEMKELSMLEEAQKNAQVYVRDFYKNLGFKNVKVTNRTLERK